MSGNGQTPLRSSVLWRHKARQGDLARNPIWADWQWGPTTTPPPTGRLKVWSGSAWALKPAKVWSGSAWVTKPAKVWNGSAWV